MGGYIARIVGRSMLMGGHSITTQEPLAGRANLLFLGIINPNSGADKRAAKKAHGDFLDYQDHDSFAECAI
jgi:hypothetical protein